MGRKKLGCIQKGSKIATTKKWTKENQKRKNPKNLQNPKKREIVKNRKNEDKLFKNLPKCTNKKYNNKNNSKNGNKKMQKSRKK